MIGLPQTAISEELMEVFRDQTATRALQRLISARTPSTIPPSLLQVGIPVLYFHKRSKHTDPTELREGIVSKPEAHFVRIKSNKNCTITVAHEDLRIRPSSLLTRQLMENNL